MIRAGIKKLQKQNNYHGLKHSCTVHVERALSDSSLGVLWFLLRRWVLGRRACEHNLSKGSFEAVSQLSKRHNEDSLAIAGVEAYPLVSACIQLRSGMGREEGGEAGRNSTTKSTLSCVHLQPLDLLRPQRVGQLIQLGLTLP